jgi:cytochrome c oxidase subunit 1
VSATAERVPAPPRGIAGWLASTDHKHTAAKMAIAAFGFFIVSGILALLMRTELAEPGMQVVSTDTYDQLFTIHGSGMIYLVLTPLALALGVYLVPLQIGAAEIALPRLTLFGLWTYVLGGLVMYGGFLTDQGAGRAGWFSYVPLSGGQATPGTGMDMWVIGVILSTLGCLIVGGAILATIIGLRAPGMTMLRLPVFTWSMLVTVLMVVIALPVLLVLMSLLLIDRHFGGIFDSGSATVTYQNLFWFYGHPVVYIMFFPFLGAVGEVVATFSRKRFFGYRPLILSLLAFAGLSMSVWAHHMFTTGQVTNQYFSLTSHMLIVPGGLEYLALIGTMIGGSILLRTPMLFALGFMALFLIGGLTGIVVASPPLDYQFNNSYFVVAHFHYTLFGGSLFGAFAAVYYWFPKVTGAVLREGLGKLHFALLFIGANLTFFPMFFLGADGMPRRVADYPASTGWQHLNEVATAGSYVIALAIAVFVANVVVSLRRRVTAGNDPWRAHTLEWWTSSPPPRHNFRSLPPIRSHAPLLDHRAGQGAVGDVGAGEAPAHEVVAS